MNRTNFPTFRKLFSSLPAWHKDPRVAVSVGPLWYAQPWYGESISSMQQSLLRLLVVAQQERLALPPLVVSLALEHRGRYRGRLFRLARRLESGLPLVSALEQTPDVLADEDVLALRLATQSGTMPEMLEELVLNHAEDQQARQSGFSYSVGYWIVLAIAILIVMLFMSLVMFPSFMRLADEMGMEAPPAFQALVSLLGNPLPLVALLFLLLACVTWLTWFRTPQRFIAQRIAPKLLRPAAQRRLVQLYRLLAVTLTAGRPIPGAISTLARHHFDSGLRRKLLVARNEIEQGEDEWQSLAGTGVLIPNEAQALRETSQTNLRAWMLKRLASQHLNSAAARTAFGAAILEPLIVLIFAGVVLWVCSSFFLFLVRIIEISA